MFQHVILYLMKYQCLCVLSSYTFLHILISLGQPEQLEFSYFFQEFIQNKNYELILLFKNSMQYKIDCQATQSYTYPSLILMYVLGDTAWAKVGYHGTTLQPQKQVIIVIFHIYLYVLEVNSQTKYEFYIFIETFIQIVSSMCSLQMFM